MATLARPTLAALARLPVADLRTMYKQVLRDLKRFWPDASAAELNAHVAGYICCGEPSPAAWVSAALDALAEAAGGPHDA